MLKFQKFAATSILFASLAISPEISQGQVFDSGPSDSSLFDTVINLPADQETLSGDIGDATGNTTTQVTVRSGATVFSNSAALSGSEVNVNGGRLFDFQAQNGSEVNMSAGDLFDFQARGGSEVNISGGDTFEFQARGGSDVNISGGFVSRVTAEFGSDLNISGGTVGRFVARGDLDISGGTVSDDFRAESGSVVNISGGFVGDGGRSPFAFGFALVAESGSEVNITGGSVGQGFNAEPGSEVNITGGSVGQGFNAESGSEVSISGGEFKLNGAAFTGATITRSPGDVFTGTLSDGSAFIITSGLTEISLTPTALPVVDNTPIVVDFFYAAPPRRPSGLRAGQTLTLQDAGRPAALVTQIRDNFAVVDATLNVEGGTVGSGLSAAQGEVNISGGTVGDFFDANSGSVVNISGGTVGDDFDANSGSVVNISGGTVGHNFDARDGSEVNISGGTVFRLRTRASEVNISGGSVGDFFDVNSDSVVNISGGTVGRDFNADSGTEVNISGGSVGDDFLALQSVVNISGGTVGDGFKALAGAEVNISGGTVGANDFQARGGSDVNLFGTEFMIDGTPLNSLVLDEPFTVTNRAGEVLSGRLNDGTTFSFELNPEIASFFDDVYFFSTSATLTVTLSAPFTLGDVNGDGVIDFLDIAPFISLLSSGGFLDEADINRDGVVNFLDLAPFIALLSGL